MKAPVVLHVEKCKQQSHRQQLDAQSKWAKTPYIGTTSNTVNYECRVPFQPSDDESDSSSEWDSSRTNSTCNRICLNLPFISVLLTILITAILLVRMPPHQKESNLETTGTETATVSLYLRERAETAPTPTSASSFAPQTVGDEFNSGVASRSREAQSPATTRRSREYVAVGRVAKSRLIVG